MFKKFIILLTFIPLIIFAQTQEENLEQIKSLLPARNNFFSQSNFETSKNQLEAIIKTNKKNYLALAVLGMLNSNLMNLNKEGALSNWRNVEMLTSQIDLNKEGQPFCSRFLYYNVGKSLALPKSLKNFSAKSYTESDMKQALVYLNKAFKSKFISNDFWLFSPPNDSMIIDEMSRVNEWLARLYVSKYEYFLASICFQNALDGFKLNKEPDYRLESLKEEVALCKILYENKGWKAIINDSPGNDVLRGEKSVLTFKPDSFKKKTKNIYSVWINEFNLDVFESNDEERIISTKVMYEFDFESMKMRPLSSIKYNQKGNISDSWKPQKEMEWSDIIPDSIGEAMYKYFKKMVAKK